MSLRSSRSCIRALAICISHTFDATEFTICGFPPKSLLLRLVESNVDETEEQRFS